MQITIAPSMRQIRYYVESAINAFETLPTQTAIESNLGHLRRLITYLDALDRGANVVVAGISAIKAGVRLECQVPPNGKIFDLIDRHFDPPSTESDPT